MDYNKVFWLLILQFLIIVCSSGIRLIQEYIDKHTEIKIDYNIQKIISNKTSSVPLAYFDMPEFYDHLNRIQGSVGNRFLAPIKNSFQIGQATIRLISYLAFLLTIHWSLLLLSVAAAIPLFIIQKKYGKRRFLLLYNQTPKAREGQYITSLLTNRESAKEIRLFQLGGYLLDRWSKTYFENARESLRLLRRNQMSNLGLEMFSGLLLTCSAGIIVWFTRSSTVRIGDFVVISQAVQGTQTSINQISSLVAQIYEESLYIQDFYKFIQFKVPILERSSQSEYPFPTPLQSGITFDNVAFRYTGSFTDSISEINFFIRAGEKIAIVGENGSGKTTLIKCLMGLYPVSSGRIYFDGINIEEIKEQDLRKNITVVFQDFMRYSFSVRDNIAFGNVERYGDIEEIKKVASKTGVDKFVKHFSKGYDTYLGKYLINGEDLSGGQWQKIALARLLFRGGEVIILDEPTASLDPRAEIELFKQFHTLTKDKTTIFISHRMAAAKMADRILVMKEGRLVEIGTHKELMENGQEYYRLYQLQSHWYSDNNISQQEVIGWMK
ncbi:ABC transporter ATP-binding protein [Effusibacillus consociatus]|uniref:ABC transporter ATP-binding protein n=2 Tax=Effusibacillus consociatus TaxID=1117041 RepID=A0ABV9Q1N9_9BACL